MKSKPEKWKLGMRPPEMEQRSMRMGQRLFLGALFLVMLSLVTAQGEPAGERFAYRIRQYKEAEGIARETLGRLMNELEQLPAFLKIDGALMTKHLEEVGRTWAEAAAALEKGDETGATALAKRAEEMIGQRDRWQERLRWRSQQAQNEYLPATAEIYFMLAPERNGDLQKEVEAFLETKKQRSEAYGRLAEATTPSAERQTLLKLQDEVFALDVEVGVADMKYSWAREDWDFHTWVATDTNVVSGELIAAKERLAQWRQQAEETYRQSRRQQHALDRLNGEREILLGAREKAYRAAKAAQKPPTQ